MKTAQEILNSFGDIDKPWTWAELHDMVTYAQRDAWEQGVRDGAHCERLRSSSDSFDDRDEPDFPGDR